MGLVTAVRNILKIPELRARVLFTLSMLTVFRIGAHIPTPGIDGEALSKFLTERGGAVMGFFDIFTGGALSKVTIFALGVMPYISASIIFQLLTVVIPSLAKLAKEGEEGRKKITVYTRYATIVIAAIQGFGISIGLESMPLTLILLKDSVLEWALQKLFQGKTKRKLSLLMVLKEQ